MIITGGFRRAYGVTLCVEYNIKGQLTSSKENIGIKTQPDIAGLAPGCVAGNDFVDFQTRS